MAEIKPYGIDASTNQPRIFQAGDSIASSNTVPTGGSTGQILTKSSATNFDVTWTTVVSQTITDGVTTAAPSENAVFDALALKVTGPSGLKIARGSLTPSGSADSISYGITFASPPTVTFGYERGGGGQIGIVNMENSSNSTTGCSVRVFNDSGSSLSSGTVYWTAIGT